MIQIGWIDLLKLPETSGNGSIGSVTLSSSQGRSYAATVAGIFGDTAVGKLNVEEETTGKQRKKSGRRPCGMFASKLRFAVIQRWFMHEFVRCPFHDVTSLRLKARWIFEWALFIYSEWNDVKIVMSANTIGSWTIFATKSVRTIWCSPLMTNLQHRFRGISCNRNRAWWIRIQNLSSYANL